MPGYPVCLPYLRDQGANVFLTAWASNPESIRHLVNLILSLSIFAFFHQSLNNEKRTPIVLVVVPMIGRS